MEIIGLIAEYNPFHNGHLYQINKIKELYPDSLIVLILNGYFLERGIISLESKMEKTRLALNNNIDVVIELPFVFGSNSADIFADSSIKLLNELKVNKLIFGSESNDLDLLYNAAKYQLNSDFDDLVKKYMDEGINYPTALNKASIYKIKDPNDLLGISYIKSIIKNNFNIEVELIKRTNSYHDIESNDSIVSASNIREKINNNLDISKYIPDGHINNIDYDLFFKLLKYKILSEDNLDKYLTVDEGIDNRLKKYINECNNIDELINKVKNKRYTYNKIMRMFIHILIGYTKEDKNKLNNIEYIKILGFSSNGSSYLSKIKKEINIPITYKPLDYLTYKYEIKAASIYKLLTNDNVLEFEYSNKPLKKEV